LEFLHLFLLADFEQQFNPALAIASKRYMVLEIPPEFDMKHTMAEITDISGRKRQSVMLTGHKPYIYTEDLPAGLYLLRLVNKQGFVSKRFVKS